MGYTHYWTNLTPTHNQDRWDAFITDVKKMFFLLNQVPFFTDIKLGGCYGEDEPIVTDDEVAFNGEIDCEDMIIRKDYSKNPVDAFKNFAFNFCKTRQRPYDTIVVAVLTLYKYHFEEDVRVSSDGDDDDLKEGRNLINRMFGYTAHFDQ